MASAWLDQIERRSWRMTHQDGLMDILFGFLLLGAGLSPLATVCGFPDWVRLLGLCVIQFSGVGFVVWMRRREVVPRLGRVRFSAKRTRRTRHMRFMLVACVAVTVLLVVLTSLSARLGFAFLGSTGAVTVWIVTTVVIMVPIGALAVYMDYPRLLLHGSLFVIVEFCLLVLGWDDASPYAATILFGAGSVISFGIGIPIFAHFLKSIPRVSTEERGGVDE